MTKATAGLYQAIFERRDDVFVRCSCAMSKSAPKFNFVLLLGLALELTGANLANLRINKYFLFAKLNKFAKTKFSQNVLKLRKCRELTFLDLDYPYTALPEDEKWARS